MKIAICDDDAGDLQLIEDYLKCYKPTMDATKFSSAKELLVAFASQFYDLVFMDLEMKSPNGFEVSTQLMGQKVKPLIIFITKSSEYTIQGYGIAFRYLLKPIDYKQFEKVLSLAIENIAPKKLVFLIEGKKQSIAVNEIFYFEVFNHNTIIHTEKKPYSTRCTLSEIMSRLDGNNFAQPHKSYFVNLSFVDCTETNQIRLTTGDIIRLSRDKKAQFCRLLGEYLGR